MLILSTVLAGAVATPFILFRIPIGRAVEGEGVAYTKKFEPNSDLRDRLFERTLGKEKLYLSDNRELFVSIEDFEKVWSVQPNRLVRYRVCPVLGGYGAAVIISTRDSEDRAKREHDEEQIRQRANQALVPTPASVTPAADAPVAPDAGAAHL